MVTVATMVGSEGLEESMGPTTLNLRAVALLAVVAVVLAACTSPGAPTDGSATGGGGTAEACTETKEMQIGWHSVSQSVWPLLIAEEEGYLDKYGIDAELIFAEGARVLSGVISQSIPISIASGSDILDPVAEGSDVIAILATGTTPTDMLVGGEGITSAEDLQGGVAGANELGGESDSLVRLALEELGLEPDVDTRVVAVGGESTRIAALEAGQVQATLVDVGLRNQMEEQGFNVLHDFTEGDFQMLKGTLITTRSFADENPETVQCVVNAVLDAILFYKENKAESVDAAATHWADMDRSAIEGLWDIYAPNIPERPTVPEEALANIQELSDEQRIKDVDLSTVIDNSFVENAELKD
jgi:NitT/TauT family transport system substrate-binding protein